MSDKTSQKLIGWIPDARRPSLRALGATCAVRGMIQPGAMCWSMIVGGKCGHNGECEHK